MARAPPMTELRLGPAQLGLRGFARRCQRYGVRNASSSYGSEAHSAAQFSRIPRPQAGASCGFSLRPTVPGSGSAVHRLTYDHNCSAVLRSAIGSGSPPRFLLHGPFAAGARGPASEEAGPEGVNGSCQCSLAVRMRRALALAPSRNQGDTRPSRANRRVPCAYLAQPYSITLVPPGFHRPFVGFKLSAFHKTETGDSNPFSKAVTTEPEVPWVHG